MWFLDIKTDGGRLKGKITFYCDALKVSRQGFYWYLRHRDDPWKYESIAEKMRTILSEDECNDTYGRCRMYEALKLKYPEDDIYSEKPLTKCVTDITEIPAKDGKLYVSAVFDCYDLGVLGLAMADNMRADLCVSTIANAHKAFPDIRGAIIHSDRGSQCTSAIFRSALNQYGIVQSMNSDGGRCHDNARCEAMWARMKGELLYGRYNTREMMIEDLKTLIWRYFIIYWNNRRICTANGGLPPMVKRQRYYESLQQAA